MDRNGSEKLPGSERTAVFHTPYHCESVKGSHVESRP